MLLTAPSIFSHNTENFYVSDLEMVKHIHPSTCYKAERLSALPHHGAIPLWPGKPTVMVQNKKLPEWLDVSACKCIQDPYIFHGGHSRLSHHCSVCRPSGGFAVLPKRMCEVSLHPHKHNGQIQIFSVDGTETKCWHTKQCSNERVPSLIVQFI